MNSDQLAEIRRGIREAMSGGDDCCVSFQVAENDDIWTQFVGNSLNCAYTSHTPPAVENLPIQLVLALGGVTIMNWEAATFVTYELTSPSVDPLSRLIDFIFTAQLGCPPGEYPLDVRVEQL